MIIYFISIIFGLVFGSFANVCISRMPKGESIRAPRSRCPKCKKPIAAYHNIPLISYFWLKGRCATCRNPISWQYPLIELLMGALFLFNSFMYGEDLMRLFIADLLTFYLLTLSVIDLKHYIIPDELSLSLGAAALVLAYGNPFLGETGFFRLGHSFLAGFLGGASMLLMAWLGEKAFKKEALGGGDVKLIAATGALLGWQGVYGPLFIGSFVGGLAGVLFLATKRKKLGESIPFGPFLSLGAYLTCLFPGLWTSLFHLQ